MNVCEFCGKEIPRGRLCTKHLAMRVLLPVRYWQMVAKSANEAAIRERMEMEYEQQRSAEVVKVLTTELAEAAEAKENMESAMRALELVRAESGKGAGRPAAGGMEGAKGARTPLGWDAETCKHWMCEPKSCQAWLSCKGRLEPREQIRELTEAMGYAGGTV